MLFCCVGSLENAFLVEVLGAGYTWIGLTDQQQHGQWMWSDGSTVQFLVNYPRTAHALGSANTGRLGDGMLAMVGGWWYCDVFRTLFCRMDLCGG